MIPCIALLYFVSIRDKLKSPIIKRVLFPILVSVSSIAIFVGLSKFATSSQEFNQNALKEKTKGMQDWHGSLGGSAYSLGTDLDFSTTGIVKLFPQAVNVTLFRPYIWESHSVFQLIAALQSTFFMIFTFNTISTCSILSDSTSELSLFSKGMVNMKNIIFNFLFLRLTTNN